MSRAIRARTVHTTAAALFGVLLFGFIVGALVHRTPFAQGMHGPVGAVVALPFVAVFATGAPILAILVARSSSALPSLTTFIGFSPAAGFVLLLFWVVLVNLR